MTVPKKNIYKRNKLNICTLTFCSLFLILGYYYRFVEVDINLEPTAHINILTINSILVGFLFTALGIFASSIDRPRIKRLDDNGYLDDYFNGLYISIMAHVISTLATVLIILGILKNLTIAYLYFQQLGLIIGITFFVKSIFKLFNLIKKMRVS